MQQTEKYKFNLIEMEDVFSPEPLNQNAENVETQLTALEQRLNQSIGTLGRTCRIETGTYTGKGSGVNKLTFTIYPMLVYAANVTGPRQYILFGRDETNVSGSMGYGISVTWQEREISWYSVSGLMGEQLNESGQPYHWVAIGYDDNNEQ